MEKGCDLAALELKALLSIDPQVSIKLDFERYQQFEKRFKDRKTLEYFVEKALSDRPEFRRSVEFADCQTQCICRDSSNISWAGSFKGRHR